MSKIKLAVTVSFVAGTISGFSTAKWSRYGTGHDRAEPHVEYEEPKDSSLEQIRANEILKYGSPNRGPDVRCYANHALCYDQRQRIPMWVAEHLTVDNMKGSANRKSAKFRPDPGVDAIFTARNTDYLGSGWSRGHMAPAGDNKRNDQSMRETFYLSNILPQNLDNNGGFWNRFEIYCRDLTKKFSHVRIISGPLFLPFKDQNENSYIKYQLIGKSQVAVPTHLYKVIVAEQENDEDKYLGVFIVPNLPIGMDEQLSKYQSTLDVLETKSGLKFLPQLDRSKAKDLCIQEGCKLKSRDEFELFFMSRKLENAGTLERLEKVWAEFKQKKLQPDDWALKVYERKKSELAKAAAAKREE